ncbi:MAG: phosphoribosylformylglycinamidine cyclo-ligase [Candidatus Omnitrophica bacterium]|nr:phosphoribosylformylglycinamidine cyclo-ligase [Candidatus Omnitrophota bacterium]
MSRISYKKSGVDIDKANIFIDKIKPIVKTTKRPGWFSNIGAFAGFFKPNLSSYKNPVITASTDGVGTKLLIAQKAGIHHTVGIDLVAMCVNDIITCGAEPLFFLDYFATGKLSVEIARSVIKGIAKGCRAAGCALIGGETAELPGMYKPGEYDLAGFSVGIAERNNIIDGSKITSGDLILGIASSGLHSNGYSLVRKIFSKNSLSRGLAKELLKPTAIYVKPVLGAVKRFNIKGIANITGGGFYDNIIRLLPGNGLLAVVYKGTWQTLSIFNMIKDKGHVEEKEMFRTLNMGIGMVMIMHRKEILKAKDYLFKKHGLRSWPIGEIIPGKKGVEIV